MLSKIKNLLPAIAILIISSSLFLTRLGSNSLADWDEAWYADASRFMFRNDHFLTPIWNGRYFFDKPPLQYWLTQPFLYLFGETELAYRLPSALAAIGLTLITYLWGGFPAAIILLTFPHFLDRGRSGNFDALFVFFTTLSMFLMFKNRPALGGIFLGLSWLTKGVFSGLFPIAVFFIMSVKSFAPKWLSKLANLSAGAPQPADPKTSFSRQPRRSQVKVYFPPGLGATTRLARIPSRACRENDIESQPEERAITAGAKLKPLLLYIFFALLVYSPWHLLEYTRFEHLINQSYFATFDQGEFGGWNWMDIAWRFDLRYLVFLWTFLRLWFPILLISLIYESITSLRARRRAGVAISLPLLTFLIVFLVLSAAKSKNDWYIMPAYPLIALIIANFLSITSLRALSAAKGVAIPGKIAKLLAKPSGFIIFITFIILISASNLYFYRRQAFPPDKWLPEKELGLAVKNLTNADDLIVTAEYEFPTLRYYSERQVRTAAPQPDYQGKYWWIWDNADIATALRHGQNIVTVHRPGTEWSIEILGYRREKLTEINNRVISRLVPNTP